MNDVLRRRIQERLAALKLSPRAASLKAGLGPDLIRDLLRRPENRLLSDSLHRVAGVLGTTSSWLLGEEDMPPVLQRPRKGSLVPIEKLVTHVEMGRVRIDRDESAPRLYWPSEWVERYLDGRPANGRYHVIEGEAYVGELSQGDIVCLDLMRIDPARDPGIYCLHDGNAVMVRRLQVLPRGRGLRVLSDNARYPAYEIERGAAHIVGRVVWRAGEL
jgi:peptidase S24-like protein